MTEEEIFLFNKAMYEKGLEMASRIDMEPAVEKAKTLYKITIIESTIFANKLLKIYEHSNIDLSWAMAGMIIASIGLSALLIIMLSMFVG